LQICLYLGFDINYEYDNSIEEKLYKCASLYGTINGTLKGKIRKDIKLKFHTIMNPHTFTWK